MLKKEINWFSKTDKKNVLKYIRIVNMKTFSQPLHTFLEPSLNSEKINKKSKSKTKA